MPGRNDHDRPRLAATCYSESRPLPDSSQSRVKPSASNGGRERPSPSNNSPSKDSNDSQDNPLGITVNTNVSRHHGRTPQQVYPGAPRNARCSTPGNGSEKRVPTSKFAPSRRINKNKNLFLAGIGGSNGQKSLAFTSVSSEGPGQKTFQQRRRDISDPISSASKTPRIVITPTDGPPHAPSPASADTDSAHPVRPNPGNNHNVCAAEALPVSVAPPLFALASTQGGENEAAAWPIERDDSSNSDQSFVTPPESRPSYGSSVHQANAHCTPQSYRFSQDSILPTPKRSSGWWNYVSSPFSTFSIGTPKTARSLAYPDEETIPSMPILSSAAPMAGDGIDGMGEAADYYDPKISFDTPTQDSDLSAYTGSETASANETSAARGLDFESESQAQRDKATGAIAARQHILDPHLYLSPRVDEECLARTRDFDPPQRGFGSYKRYEVESPTSPSPILGVASVSRFRPLKDAGADSEPIKLVMHTPRQKALEPLPPTPPADSPLGFVSPILKPVNRWAKEPPPLPPPAEFSFQHVYPYSYPREKSRGFHSRDLERFESEEPSGKCDYLFIGITAVLFVLVVLAVLLALFIKPQGTDVSIESQWLNLTGFPPIPTGVSTVAKPDAVGQVSGCVRQTNLWSCSLPKEVYAHPAKGEGTSPNFRFEIRFDRSSIANSSLTQQQIAKRAFSSTAPIAMVGRLVRDAVQLAKRSLPGLFQAPEPSPPSRQDQSFLANTTDGVSHPFGGEKTPFSITFLALTPAPQTGHSKRGFPSTASLSNLTSNIPAPLRALNSLALAPAALYPFPAAQPLRLYNRGLDTEHYGFYNYFDKSIFLAAPTAANTSTRINSTSMTLTSSNANGGVPRSAANTLCVFSQTRYLMQIWTRQPRASLLSPPPSGGNSSTRFYTMPNGTLTASNPEPDSETASAYDFTRPGSFPLPVSITLDRHGGDAARKAVYCYGLNGEGNVVQGAKMVVAEDRAFGGKIVNAAAPFERVDLAQRGWTGVDGGTGGCRCEWRNWV